VGAPDAPPLAREGAGNGRSRRWPAAATAPGGGHGGIVCGGGQETIAQDGDQGAVAQDGGEGGGHGPAAGGRHREGQARLGTGRTAGRGGYHAAIAPGGLQEAIGSRGREAASGLGVREDAIGLGVQAPAPLAGAVDTPRGPA
jgi:hypothetical protein